MRKATANAAARSVYACPIVPCVPGMRWYGGMAG
jgi:hypothetical protein